MWTSPSRVSVRLTGSTRRLFLHGVRLLCEKFLAKGWDSLNDGAGIGRRIRSDDCRFSEWTSRERIVALWMVSKSLIARSSREVDPGLVASVVDAVAYAIVDEVFEECAWQDETEEARERVQASLRQLFDERFSSGDLFTRLGSRDLDRWEFSICLIGDTIVGEGVERQDRGPKVTGDDLVEAGRWLKKWLP